MRGIVYLFSGVGYAERMVTSWYHLRKHYRGPVAVLCSDDASRGVAELAAKQCDLDVRTTPPNQVVRHASYLQKTFIPAWTPYEETLFVDGDTVCVSANLDDLWGHDLMVTSYSTWVSTGRRISGRIGQWKGVSRFIDALVLDQQTKTYPALNTGVFSFKKGNPDLALWHEVTKAGAGKFITDEIAMQLLLSHIAPERVKILDDRWNCSPLYGAHKDDVRIWHMHGNKHLRRDAGKVLWWPAFLEAREANVGGVADWAGKHDRWVKAELENKHAEV